MKYLLLILLLICIPAHAGNINNTVLNALTGYAGTPTCGAGCASVGAGSTNTRGSMVSGTTVTSIALNFSTTLATTPTCVITDNSTATVADISAVSTSSLTVATAAAVTSATIYYICVQ